MNWIFLLSVITLSLQSIALSDNKDMITNETNFEAEIKFGVILIHTDGDRMGDYTVKIKDSKMIISNQRDANDKNYNQHIYNTKLPDNYNDLIINYNDNLITIERNKKY